MQHQTDREPLLAIGDLARRAGIAASALRYYESKGFLVSTRSSGGQRRYPRSALRRVAFIRAAQTVGLSLDEIANALATLPDARTPTAKDWHNLSSGWKKLIDERIDALRRLRQTLDGCIGCGCLSLEHCALYNPSDIAARRGPGARYLEGDQAADVLAKATGRAQDRVPASQPASRHRPPGAR